MGEAATIVKLEAAVTADLAGGWAGSTDTEVETWLLGIVTRKNNVGWSDYMLWLGRHNGLDKLETGKASGSTQTIQNSAGLALVVANAGQELQLSDDEIRGFLGNLIPEIFSGAERNDLLAFSDETVTRAVFYGVPRGLGAIARARAIS